MISNPYAPLSPFDQAESSFVKVRLNGLTTRELTRLFLPNLPAIAVVLAARAVRRTIYSQYGHEPLRWTSLESDEFGRATRDLLETRMAELTRHGFGWSFGYAIPCVGDWNGYVCVLADERRRTWASCSCQRIGRRIRRFVTVGTFLQDGRLLNTTDARPGIDPPPHVRTRYCTRRPITTLLASHRNWLADLPPQLVREWSAAELIELLQDHKRRCCEHYRQRMLWVPMSVSEVAVGTVHATVAGDVRL